MPTLDDVRKLTGLIKTASDTEYVFSRLQSAEWIPLLSKAGLFASPYEPIPEGDSALLPSWPQSRFLARLAAQKLDRPNQEMILEVALAIPETRNVRIYQDLAEVALGLDPDLSAKLAAKAELWLRSPFRFGLSWKLGALITHLARGKQLRAAMRLARTVLEIEENPQWKESKKGESLLGRSRGIATRFDLWEYEQVLARDVPELVDAVGNEALTLLADLLDKAISLSAGDLQSPHDLSHIWRPAIEEHHQNLKMGVRDLLVGAVRDAAERIVKRAPSLTIDVVTKVAERGESWLVFRRIALHLLRVFSENVPALVREYLLNRDLFDSIEVRHEYFLLERECFGRLAAEDQEVIVGWIEGGPQYTEEKLRRWEEATGRVWTPEDKARYERQWKRDRFAPLENYLGQSWAREYGRLLAQEGTSNHPEFAAYFSEGGAWGPTSPRSRDELAEASPAALVSYLQEWKPTGDWFKGASPEGLGRELTALVAEQPERYATAWSEFTQLSEPTYVRAIVEGFQNALAAKRRFNWSSVLSFCVWAVRQQAEMPNRDAHRFEMDAHWGWTKAAISRLLTEGFSSTENPIPFELREDVWVGISVGARDPEPTPEQEKEYVEKFRGGERNEAGPTKTKAFDPFTNSMNMPRSVAIESVVRYALWVRSGYEKSEDGHSLAKGFDAMPEVREVLDFHLNPQNDPSVTVRTVYGQRASWLQLLDEKWARRNTERIFARSNPELWHAAWDAYIGYSQPFDNAFDWLQGEYAYAVGQMGSHDHGWSQPLAPDYSLAQHLVSFYWRGKLGLESEILTGFFSSADSLLQAHVLSYIGRSLRNAAGSVPAEIIERLKALWVKLVAAAKRRSDLSHDEFKEYGWWFASCKLDDQWSVDQLLEALRLAKRVEPDHLVAERLVVLAVSMPGRSVEALRLMIEGDSRGWGVLGWTDKAKEIIRAARKSGDARAQETAEYLVNLLGSRGHFDFGELLKEPA